MCDAPSEFLILFPVALSDHAPANRPSPLVYGYGRKEITPRESRGTLPDVRSQRNRPGLKPRHRFRLRR
jgi:hypothetical protein